MSSPGRIMLAEAIGTFALIFIGVLSISAGPFVGAPGAPSLATIAFAHGLTIAVMVAALGQVSGGHFNPAVTFGFVVTGRLAPGMGALYWIAQLAGATAAGFAVVAIAGTATVATGTPALGTAVSPGMAIALEAVGTFFLVLVIFGTAVDERAPRSVYPLAIGLTITLDIMAIGPMTGGAVNPARSLGPALASGHWAAEWVYWVGPLLGGGAGALVEHLFLIEGAPSPETAARGGPAPAEEREG